MTLFTSSARLVLAIALVVLAMTIGQASLAGDLHGARVEGLRADLRGLRGRVDDAPRASVYDVTSNFCTDAATLAA
jgi:hypothetical protein